MRRISTVNDYSKRQLTAGMVAIVSLVLFIEVGLGEVVDSIPFTATTRQIVVRLLMVGLLFYIYLLILDYVSDRRIRNGVFNPAQINERLLLSGDAEFMTEAAEILNDVIRKRRSIYPYQFQKGRRIPDEIIWQILENANRAPNHKQTEPWRFNVYTGQGLHRLGGLQSGVYRAYAGESFDEARFQKLINYPLMSSHVISIAMKRSPGNRLPEIEEVEAVACAAQNMFLTVTAYGLGCYWSSAGITYFDQSKAYFGLQPEDKLLGFFYIGYVQKPVTAISKRGPIGAKVDWFESAR